MLYLHFTSTNPQTKTFCLVTHTCLSSKKKQNKTFFCRTWMLLSIAIAFFFQKNEVLLKFSFVTVSHSSTGSKVNAGLVSQERTEWCNTGPRPSLIRYIKPGPPTRWVFAELSVLSSRPVHLCACYHGIRRSSRLSAGLWPRKSFQCND